MEVGFSASHGRSNTEFVLRTLDALWEYAFTRFELCNGGGVDRFIAYPVLPRLNACKRPPEPEGTALRQIMARAKQQRRQTALWVHELIAPRELLDIYPELKTPRGDVNLAHPLLAEFINAKYDTFFSAFPEVDAVTLTLTEVIFPVAHRFDSAWTPEECIHWIIALVYGACRRHGRCLIVRPFSAIRSDYEAARRALARLPDDIEIMDKSDPFDWNPHLPINPELATWPPERLTVEFDLAGEYFGRGTLPVVFADYLRARLDHARTLGARRVVGRVDRWGRSALDREGRLNVRFFAEYARDPGLDAEDLLAREAAAHYRTRDADRLVRALCDGFEVVKKMFYVDGHLLFHETFAGLRHAQNTAVFETLRPGQPLAHCRDEWAILSDRTTPSVEAVRHEKDEAVRLAQDVLRRIKDLAPDEAQLRAHAEDLVLLARLYRAATAAAQEYVLQVREGEEAAGRFVGACDALDAVVAELAASRPENWLTNVLTMAQSFAADLRKAFDLERKVYREMPGISPAERACVEDMIAAGYPGEGHRLSKYTHGAPAQSDGVHFWRSVSRHMAYTLRAGAGARRLRFEAAGAGRLTLSTSAGTLLRREWSGGEGWETREEKFVSPGGEIEMRVERVASSRPEIGLVYLLSGDA